MDLMIGLTPDMRDWLNAQDGRVLFRDLVPGFVERYHLTDGEAGILLGIWARELAAPKARVAA